MSGFALAKSMTKFVCLFVFLALFLTYYLAREVVQHDFDLSHVVVVAYGFVPTLMSSNHQIKSTEKPSTLRNVRLRCDRNLGSDKVMEVMIFSPTSTMLCGHAFLS